MCAPNVYSDQGRHWPWLVFLPASGWRKARQRIEGYNLSGLLEEERRGEGIESKGVGGGGSNVGFDKVVNGKKVNGVMIGEKTDTLPDVGEDESLKNFKLRRFVEKRLVYRQTFVIRSYEIGPAKTATMETLMNLLQRLPLNVLEDYHLTSITLEYRRECRQSNLLESLTTMETRKAGGKLASKSSCKCDPGSTHLLCLQEDKAEIVRARAEWRANQHT